VKYHRHDWLTSVADYVVSTATRMENYAISIVVGQTMPSTMVIYAIP